MNAAERDQYLPVLRQQHHANCFVCGSPRGQGLGLDFRTAPDGVVQASFACEPVFAGYPGMLHGGIICTLLDGAMTNCLFAHGLAAVTVDMNVRFRRPVAISLPAVVRGWLESKASPVYRLASEVLQDEQVVATATARFVDKRAMFWFGKK
jgi:uncharacterized protein (TIGR00369 family)